MDKKGVNSNINETDLTILMQLAKEAKDPESILSIPDYQSMIHEQDKRGWTPIMFAAFYNNNSEVLEVLIEAGASIYHWDNQLRTPLMLAAQNNGNPDILSILLEAGAKIENKDKYGRTPLFLAAGHSNNPNVIKVLKSAGAEINYHIKLDIELLISEATVKNQSEIVYTLLEAVQSMGYEGEKDITPLDITPLLYAVAMNKNPGMISGLIEYGANITEAEKLLGTPLVFALRGKRRPGIVEMLIKGGANVEESFDPFGSPLKCAVARKRDPEVIALLFKSGVRFDLESGYDQSLIMAAAASDSKPKVILHFLDAGIDVNYRDSNGRTFLMFASQYNNNNEVISTLINHGANVNDKDDMYNMTPLMYAARYNKSPEIITALIKLGANIEAKDRWGNMTPLMYAAQYTETPEIISALVNGGAKIESRNKDWNTSLIIAVKENSDKIISALLNAGADVNAKNFISDITPLSVAIHDKNLNAISILLASGADLQLKTDQGYSSYELAGKIPEIKKSQIYLDMTKNIEEKNRRLRASILESNKQIDNPLLKEMKKFSSPAEFELLVNRNMRFVETGSFERDSDNNYPINVIKSLNYNPNNVKKPSVHNTPLHHSVTVSSFYISMFVVTQKSYLDIMGKVLDYGYGNKGDKFPAIKIPWDDAIRFCNKLSNLDGLDYAYSMDGNNIICDWESNGYRLPTEAEWEFAARGGKISQGYKFAGSNNIDDVGWHQHNSNHRLHPVGELQVNELGLFDMCGNISEWCWDWFDNYSITEENNPLGPYNGSYKVIRGGSYFYLSNLSKLTDRGRMNPFNGAGFRLVRSVKDVNKKNDLTNSVEDRVKENMLKKQLRINSTKKKATFLEKIISFFIIA